MSWNITPSMYLNNMGWKPFTATKGFHSSLYQFNVITAHNTYTIVSVSCSIPAVFPHPLVNIPMCSPQKTVQLFNCSTHYLLWAVTSSMGQRWTKMVIFTNVHPVSVGFLRVVFTREGCLEVQASPADQTTRCTPLTPGTLAPWWKAYEHAYLMGITVV